MHNRIYIRILGSPFPRIGINVLPKGENIKERSYFFFFTSTTLPCQPTLFSPHHRVLHSHGVEDLLPHPGALLADGVHVELGDAAGQRLVLLVLVLLHWKGDK